MQAAVGPALFQDAVQPALVLVEERGDRVLHRLREGLVLRGEHAAQAHLAVAQHPQVQARVGVQLRARSAVRGVEARESFHETAGVTGDERLAEGGLAGEVVVQGGLGDLQLGSDVGVAEAVEPADLDQPLGHVQDPHGRARIIGPAPSNHKALRSP